MAEAMEELRPVPRERAILESFFTQLGMFSFDRAKDYVEKEKDGSTKAAGPTWAPLLAALAHLAAAEKAYHHMTFLGQKMGGQSFFSRKDSIRTIYASLHNELRKVMTSGRHGQPGSASYLEDLLSHLSEQLCHFAQARTEMADLYEKMHSLGGQKSVNSEELVCTLEAVLHKYSSKWVSPPHPGPRGGGLPDGGGRGDPAAALPGPGVGVALPAGAAQPARRHLQAGRLGPAVPAAEGDPQAPVRGPVPEGRAAAAPVRLAAALPGGAARQVQLLLPRGAEPAGGDGGGHAGADGARGARLPREDLQLHPQARRQQRVAGVRQPRLGELPGPRVPPPALVPRGAQGRGAVPRRGVAALGRAPAHALAQRHHDDGRPRGGAQRARQGGALLRRQGAEHLLPDAARAALHARGHLRRQEVGEGRAHRRLPAGDLRLAAQLQTVQQPQAGLQGLTGASHELIMVLL
ncbi:KICSTOR subunit 2 isoform X1 [Pungitius pungitius]|uniref:KICSTOR subunit 2 isoform X1 n=1 Tax=Pungitius pungitius TaxID=134920 RepID=UPI0018874947|nr:KICSTOR subunit 2 isoform X1 [Pungitius pungitius]